MVTSKNVHFHVETVNYFELLFYNGIWQIRSVSFKNLNYPIVLTTAPWDA